MAFLVGTRFEWRKGGRKGVGKRRVRWQISDRRGGTDVPCRHSRIWAVEIGSLDGCLEHGREKVLSFALDNVSQSFLWGFYWPLGRDGTRNRGRNHPVLLGPPDAGAGQGILLSARIHPNGRSRRRTVGEYTCSERARSGSMHRG